MSLKARLKRLEAQVKWLEFDGMLRLCELKLELLDKKRQIADHLAANPEAAALFAAVGITSIRPTPRPLSPVNLVKEISSPAGRGGPQGRRGTRSLNTNIATVMKTESPSALRAPPPAGEESRVVRPSPPERPPPESPPKTEAWTHDPPEHMQIEKVTWRMRTSQDDLDDDDDGDDEEYCDPLRDA